MSDKVKERIEKEADEYCAGEYDVNTTSYLIARYFYIQAATAERPIAWNEAIDECIKELSSTTEVTRLLEKLKHKQP